MGVWRLEEEVQKEIASKIKEPASAFIGNYTGWAQSDFLRKADVRPSHARIISAYEQARVK